MGFPAGARPRPTHACLRAPAHCAGWSLNQRQPQHGPFWFSGAQGEARGSPRCGVQGVSPGRCQAGPCTQRGVRVRACASRRGGDRTELFLQPVPSCGRTQSPTTGCLRLREGRSFGDKGRQRLHSLARRWEWGPLPAPQQTAETRGTAPPSRVWACLRPLCALLGLQACLGGRSLSRRLSQVGDGAIGQGPAGGQGLGGEGGPLRGPWSWICAHPGESVWEP